MTFLNALYKLFIGPLELFFEVVFVLADRLIGNLGLSIIVLSLIMNFLVLPLYRRADAMQDEQRDTENKLKKWVTHIKKNFKGDERFMMLQTYYRQNDYKPTSILKGSVSLLLEIPFFIAAYNFLSHAGVFDGFSFGPFADMGKPDGLLKIGTFSINILPILMTAINIVSSAIYTKGLPTSSKIQLYGMAGIFLILLYNSPACLVFYWTLNNLFSLVKNLFYKLKNPKFVLGILSSVLGCGVLLFLLIKHPFNTLKKNLFVIALVMILQIPLVLYFCRKHIKSNRVIEFTKTDKSIFYLSVLLLTVLTGVLIPSAVIHSSPEEFINTLTFRSPLVYILNSLLLAFGTFFIWFSIFFALANNSGKKIISFVTCILSVTGIVNYMAFGKNLGTISPLLVFDKGIHYSKQNILINLVVIIAVAILVYFIWKYKRTFIKVLFASASICFAIMSVMNCVKINSVVAKKEKNLTTVNDNNVSFPLSTNGKNVIVMMLDRAINSYIPYIFNEKPEVAKQFEGFTYYPNTVSYGPFTNTGAPGLYGGYEYIPEEMNKRSEEPLVQKHNEALKVMPVLFNQNGFDVTVFDPTYAGYDWIPDLSIYDDYPEIEKYITMGNSNILDPEFKSVVENNKQHKLDRDFFIYSLVKISPLVIQPTVYNGGKYNKINIDYEQFANGIYKAKGKDNTFMESYEVLKSLPKLLEIKDSMENTFLMMSNDTTHCPCLLQEPEYEPADIVDNTDYELNNSERFNLNGNHMNMNKLDQMQHYQMNMAAMIQLGNFFDYLRENDVYDNTKIILVADHGRDLAQFDNLIFGKDKGEDVMFFNPLLMVKDFDSKEFVTDNSFMTNADVPTLATKDLIDNPINPFTNKKIENSHKNGKQNIFLSYKWSTSENNGNTFLPGSWYSVQDNIFDINNWEKIEEPR